MRGIHPLFLTRHAVVGIDEFVYMIGVAVRLRTYTLKVCLYDGVAVLFSMGDD